MSSSHLRDSSDQAQIISDPEHHSFPRVFTEIVFDHLTPVSAFLTMRKHFANCCVLESAEQHESLGRYSFISAEPLLVFESFGTRLRITVGKKTPITEESATPLRVFEEYFQQYALPPNSQIPQEECGAIGYIGYDAARSFERLPDTHADQTSVPDIWLVIPSVLLVFDNMRKTLKIFVRGDAAEVDCQGKSRAALEKILSLLHTQPRLSLKPKFVGSNPIADEQSDPYTCNTERHHFLDAVRQAKKHIKDGDIFQVVLSQRFEMPFAGDYFEMYRALRTINPSPYMFFLDCGDFSVVGSSPEVMVARKGDELTLRPIAGTVKRGSTVEEDQRLERELLSDPKENAEHMMLIDLGRNDLGRLCRYGSVEVTDMLTVENYSHVKHIVTNLRGIINEGYSLHDIFRAVFPAGTLSGAPKVRAMEIIDALEVDRRGVYGGAIVNLEFNGNITSCIAIRTAVIHHATAYIQAGAGIVYDSEPDKEYEETLNKARALMNAVSRCSQS